MALIIVESPTKARTFNRILKSDKYFVFATMGHIRDLPAKTLAVDYKKKFKPDYEIITSKRKTVSELKKLVKINQELIFATDPDREGESIAYHVAFLAGLIKENWPKATIRDGESLKRIVFHEITPQALKSALKDPQTLRLNLVYAQQARRILDRIVGYELSPLLWKKMGKNWLSAGRVQTVALRLIVEREKEIRQFKVEDYFQIYGFFLDSVSNSLPPVLATSSRLEKSLRAVGSPSSSTPKKNEPIKAKLISKDDIPYEQKFTINLFAGEYKYTKTSISENTIEKLKKDLQSDLYRVSDLKEDIITRYPPPPFTTSLLAQDSFYRFGFSTKMTMRLAQDLYERGLITYHRTDSFNLSSQFVFKAKDYIEEIYGKEYSLDKPRGYKTKSKMAQEAHEAIRPTKLEPLAADKRTDKKITLNHKRLYGLIFNRAVSTQMKEAQIKNITINILGNKGYLFQSELQQVIFAGFLKLLNPQFVEKNQKVASGIKLKIDRKLELNSLDAIKNQTKPPFRYNEASLIKTLEEKGIGRPSTYAPIISLIQDKNYVEKEFRHFIPTKLGEIISDYLSAAFPNIFNLNFTAGMENALDDIAQNKLNLVQLLTDFNSPFQTELKEKKKEKKVIDVEEKIEEKCPRCNSQLVVRYSKFGKFLACSSFPKCKFTKPFLKFIPDKFCPLDKGKIVLRFTKKRKKFFGCENYPKCKWSAWKLK